VSNVTYNAANQLLGLNYLGIAETRQYNNLNQMTNLTAGSLINITYTYPAGANNGKISQQAVSGETVTYQYDSLNRLLSATSNQSWSESYGYDGFGNLLSKTPTGGAPTLSQAVNAATNQLVNVSYDANGNQLDGLYSYDAENRLALAPGIQYGYDSRNKRVWSGTTSGSTITQTVYFYGVDGQRLGIYSFTTPPSEGGSPELSAVAKSLGVYFGSKRVGTVTNGATASFTQDRLGSTGTYYPYGEARGTVPQDDVGFATYTNDSATGLDYADQRYYASNFGRFMSSDPGNAGGLSNPQSLNRYSYVLNDPINGSDPRGLCGVFLAGINTSPPASQDLQTFAEATGDITAFPYAGGGIPSDVADIMVQSGGFPTGTTLTALEAIALAAQSPGPINILAYSGGAAALQSAWRFLTPAIQARITSITYIDPGSFGTTLPVAANTTVFGDTSTLTNSFLNKLE
jgi:RHS repeat-associated protein